MKNINLYKRLALVLLLLCLAGAVFAQTVGQFGDIEDILNDYEDGSRTTLEPELIDELIAMWKRGELDNYKDRILNEINGEITDYLKNKYLNAFTYPKELILGFADASVFASGNNALRGYANYKNFAFSLGVVAGLRLPGGFLHPIDDIISAGDNIIDNPDISLGVNLQAINSQIGINLSQILDGLYMGVSFTYYVLCNFQDFSLETNTMGLTAHYQLIKGMDAGNGWHRGFKWGGLTLGTGLIYSNTALKCNYPIGDYKVYDDFVAQGADLNLKIDITTYTIPLEVYTSAFFLWIFNVHFGVGVDVAFGRNTTSLNFDTRIVYADTDDFGPLTVTGGGSMSPSLINVKMLGGLGVKFGHFIFDIPISYYFFRKGAGLSLGVTLGAVY